MKKIFGGIGIFVFLLIIGFVGTWETKYDLDCTCIKVDAETASFCDNNGHVWEWELEENDFIQLDKTYILHMNNNHTASVLDDEIESFSKK